MALKNKYRRYKNIFLKTKHLWAFCIIVRVGAIVRKDGFLRFNKYINNPSARSTSPAFQPKCYFFTRVFFVGLLVVPFLGKRKSSIFYHTLSTIIKNIRKRGTFSYKSEIVSSHKRPHLISPLWCVALIESCYFVLMY